MTDDKDIELAQDGEVQAEQPQDQAEDAVESSPDDMSPDMDSPPGDDGAEVDPLADLEGLADSSADPGEADEPADDFKVVNPEDANEDDAEAAMLKMLEGLPDEEQAAAPEDINFGSASVSSAEFQQLKQSSEAGEPRNIDLLMDVDLPVSIELGRTKMSISDILSLGPGSVVELNKLAGEPADLLINYKVVARGEVVVIDENFGLRITQLMTPEERLKALADE